MISKYYGTQLNKEQLSQPVSKHLIQLVCYYTSCLQFTLRLAGYNTIADDASGTTVYCCTKVRTKEPNCQLQTSSIRLILVYYHRLPVFPQFLSMLGFFSLPIMNIYEKNCELLLDESLRCRTTCSVVLRRNGRTI